MRYHESEEMYLETILLLQRKHQFVRSIDIAMELGYSKPSVSVAVKKLVHEGLITVESGGKIELTTLGEQRAVDIYDRHRVITELLVRIGANRAVAEENACRIEHVISAELVEVIRESLKRNQIDLPYQTGIECAI